MEVACQKDQTHSQRQHRQPNSHQHRAIETVPERRATDHPTDPSGIHQITDRVPVSSSAVLVSRRGGFVPVRWMYVCTMDGTSRPRPKPPISCISRVLAQSLTDRYPPTNRNAIMSTHQPQCNHVPPCTQATQLTPYPPTRPPRASRVRNRFGVWLTSFPIVVNQLIAGSLRLICNLIGSRSLFHPRSCMRSRLRIRKRCKRYA